MGGIGGYIAYRWPGSTRIGAAQTSHWGPDGDLETALLASMGGARAFAKAKGKVGAWAFAFAKGGAWAFAKAKAGTCGFDKGVA